LSAEYKFNVIRTTHTNQKYVHTLNYISKSDSFARADQLTYKLCQLYRQVTVGDLIQVNYKPFWPKARFFHYTHVR